MSQEGSRGSHVASEGGSKCLGALKGNVLWPAPRDPQRPHSWPHNPDSPLCTSPPVRQHICQHVERFTPNKGRSWNVPAVSCSPSSCIPVQEYSPFSHVLSPFSLKQDPPFDFFHMNTTLPRGMGCFHPRVTSPSPRTSPTLSNSSSAVTQSCRTL